MLNLSIALVWGFLWGVRRGSSSCLALCVPSIIPTLVEERGSWKKGFTVALWFNLPRIILLTLLGMVIGASGFVIAEGVGVFTSGSAIWALGYGIVGCIMIIYGTFVFASVSQSLDSPKGNEAGDCGPVMSHPLLSRFNMIVPRSRSGLVLWGGLVSIACVGETILAAETICVGVFTARAASSTLGGAALGGLAFLLFALGTALPSMSIAAFSTTLADREKQKGRLLGIQRLSGALMIIFGGILVMTALFVI